MELIYQHGGVSQVAIGKMLEIGAGGSNLDSSTQPGEILKPLSDLRFSLDLFADRFAIAAHQTLIHVHSQATGGDVRIFSTPSLGQTIPKSGGRKRFRFEDHGNGGLLLRGKLKQAGINVMHREVEHASGNTSATQRKLYAL